MPSGIPYHASPTALTDKTVSKPQTRRKAGSVSLRYFFQEPTLTDAQIAGQGRQSVFCFFQALDVLFHTGELDNLNGNRANGFTGLFVQLFYVTILEKPLAALITN